IRGDRQPAAAADLHARDTLIPALDHAPLPETEAERVAAIPRCVELLAGRPADADVVDVHLAARNCLFALADHEVFELELLGRLPIRRDVDLRLLARGHGDTVIDRCRSARRVLLSGAVVRGAARVTSGPPRVRRGRT